MPNYASKVVSPTTYNFQQTSAVGSSFWIEQIDNESPGNLEMSSKFARATLYAYIPDDRTSFYNFINNLLGYTVTLGNQTLHRVNPQEHPKYKGLYASKISSLEGIVYKQRDEGNPSPAQIPSGLKSYASYKRNLVAVEFTPLKYPIYEDSDPEITGSTNAGEYRRNVEYDTTTNVYDVTIPTGTFKFAQGAAGAPYGISFPGELNFLEVKTTFNLKWRGVPADYIYDTLNYAFGRPTKLSGVAGKVNSGPAFGYPVGTLLMLEPQIDRYVSPTLRSSDGRTPYFLCDVLLPIIHFDPPYYTTPPTFYGHNLKPWWKPGDGTITYYLVSDSGTSSGIRIYGETDYLNIFKHWAA
jgi:hypothetical protein